jgi:hypothetical protein
MLANRKKCLGKEMKAWKPRQGALMRSLKSFKVCLSPRWISTKPGQKPSQEKNGRQPKGNESWPRTHLKEEI